MSSLRLRTETLKEASDFVRYWAEIEALRKSLDAEGDVLLDPLHFLASTDGSRRSCSVACWQEDALVGLMFGTERYVRGFRTGYAVGGDFVGRGLLLCRPEDEDDVIGAAIHEMLSRGIHSMHLRLSPRGHAQPASTRASIKCLDARVPGDRMELPGSYDDFLATLGKHTRRNIRNFARKSQAAGIEFVPSLSKSEYEAAASRLNAKSSFPHGHSHFAADERLLDLHSGSRRMALVAGDGSVLAVLCGFTQATRFHLLTQVNDATPEDLSLSVVLRGHAIRHLISTGHTELQFVGGTSLIFGRFCAPRVYESILVDKRWSPASFVKRSGRRLVDLMALSGRPAPRILEMLCNGYLDDRHIVASTAVGLAGVPFHKHRASHGPPEDAARP